MAEGARCPPGGSDQSLERNAREEHEVARGIETQPVTTEAPEAERLEIRCRDPQEASGAKEPGAAPQIDSRIVQVLDHVAERDRIEPAAMLAPGRGPRACPASPAPPDARRSGHGRRVRVETLGPPAEGRHVLDEGAAPATHVQQPAAGAGGQVADLAATIAPRDGISRPDHSTARDPRHPGVSAARAAVVVRQSAGAGDAAEAGGDADPCV